MYGHAGRSKTSRTPVPSHPYQTGVTSPTRRQRTADPHGRHGADAAMIAAVSSNVHGKDMETWWRIRASYSHRGRHSADGGNYASANSSGPSFLARTVVRSKRASRRRPRPDVGQVRRGVCILD